MKVQLLIDKAIARNCERQKTTNLRMTWIYFQDVYDKVSHSWMFESLLLLDEVEHIKEHLLIVAVIPIVVRFLIFSHSAFSLPYVNC